MACNTIYIQSFKRHFKLSVCVYMCLIYGYQFIDNTKIFIKPFMNIGGRQPRGVT